LSKAPALRRNYRVLAKSIVIWKAYLFCLIIKNMLRCNCIRRSSSTNLYKRLLSSWTSWNSGPINKLTNSIIVRISNSIIVRTKFHNILSWWSACVTNMIFIFKEFTRRIVKNRLSHHTRMSIWIGKTLIFRLVIEIICWTSNKASLSTSRSSSKHTGIPFRHLISKTFLWYNKTWIPGSI